MRALLFETRTGHPIRDLETVSWSCDGGILAPDKLEVQVPGYTRLAKSLDLRTLLTPLKHSVALIDETVIDTPVVRAAGPITAAPTSPDEDGREGYKVTGYGPERLLEHRHVRLHPGWPLLGTDGKPTGTFDVTFTGVEYGTMMKRLVAESEKWVGGDLPIIYEPDRAGTRQKTYEAIDGKPVLEALDDLADLMGGPEYAFVPEIDGADNISWRLVTGTDAHPAIVGSDHLLWNLGGPHPDVRGYERTPSLTEVATAAVYMGGKGDDSTVAARGYSAELLERGWPMVEIWDSSHASVSQQSTMQAWADGRLGGLQDRISFEVRRERAHVVRPGDLVTLEAQEHWDLLDGSYDMRVLSVSYSSSSPDWVGVQLI